MLHLIKEKIRRQEIQFITYSDYMKMALYDPHFGYYMKDGEKIGKQGDFYTSVNLSDVLGTLLGKWFCKLFHTSGLTPVICELGGGTGKLARHILESIKQTDPELYSKTVYYIVETSPFHQKLQQDCLSSFEHVQIVSTIEELGQIEGIVFSNEFFDAFPVHVIEMYRGRLFEVMVSCNSSGNDLAEHLVPLENSEIISYLENEKLVLQEKQRLEIPLPMLEYLEKIAGILTKGLMVTMDYGYTHDEWELPQHRRGSLRGYYKHEMIEDVLEKPGEMDITSHIHFSALSSYLKSRGFIQEYLLRQDEFLLQLGILKELEEHYDPNPFTEKSKRNRAIRDLLIPGGISSFFRVDLQLKGLEDKRNVLFTENENGKTHET
ncbi:SAM-dependent MidA family methyltransferase [Peribacillus deserti]|uniref:SAM-dependent MidA family methyltransferase n=1 Tax=Peribacillus deserti TaxID=673318 RepID=A0ABS2QJE8_9BACI|nr:SAM-dependent methyltransferase [Peribacillus deserti]MBM7693290.1 SAM-dependent MidA family methyltransferase [Peribacillus deserti]